MNAQLKNLLKSPLLQILGGAGMVISAFCEVAAPFIGDHGVGAEHGVLLFGVVQLAKGLVGAAEGVEKIESGIEEERTHT